LDTVKQIINGKYKGLFEKIQNHIVSSEQEFTKNDKAESFLWEHTMQVANMAKYISNLENIPPFLPVLSALFHDAGKFVKGEYHKKDVAEESDSLKVARKLLKNIGADKQFILQLTNSLSALYNEEKENDIVADIVHDSDFLVKFGFTGIATLFQKATLRGMTIETAIFSTFSKEYTYALNLEKNIRTNCAKKIAKEKSKAHMFFLDNLIGELTAYNDIKFQKIEKSLPCPNDNTIKIPFILISTKNCNKCNNELTLSYTTEKGLKCTKLISTFKCNFCQKETSISFCLPELCRQ
jgi:HD superfamily phosphodiesterase